MKAPRDWILASASPRRHELLLRLLPTFEVVSADVEEWEPEEADPIEQTTENAWRKAAAVGSKHPQSCIIAADTTVALGRRLFAKPANREEAVSMLEQLSGAEHTVVTGVVIRNGEVMHCFSESSKVRFKTLDSTLIDTYLERVHVYDKAGAYAIQEHGDLIIEGYVGTFENIMGLPIQRLGVELVQLGLMDSFDAK